jgi:phosphoribosylamine--glycine ligase
MAGELAAVSARWRPEAALGVVLAAGGYPGDYAKGTLLSGALHRDTSEVQVFHAGTALRDANIVSTGGRVLCVTALGADLQEARARAYGALTEIDMPGGFYRSDIGTASSA